MLKTVLNILTGKTWVKESWEFGGYMGTYRVGGIAQTWSGHPVFRFVKADSNVTYDINRVNRMGWPVRNYEIEYITEREKEVMECEGIFDNYYKVYRKK